MPSRRGGKERPAPQWSRQKMLALLVGAGLCVMLLVAGLVLAVVYAVSPIEQTAADRSGHGGPNGSPAQSAAADPRDVLAARPMPSVGPEASHPGPVSTADPGPPIVLPAATRIGPGRVPTGFPRTPAGAMAQLAAIDQVAIQSGSLSGAREVITNWSVPGGPTASSWSVVRALGVLFNAADLSGGGSSRLAIVLTPLMGQIKGSVGPDFIVPCVDFELDVTVQQTARGAIADCQRMVWTVDRWMIGAGSEPATPPSVWPNTDTAMRVGYRDIRRELSHAS